MSDASRSPLRHALVAWRETIGPANVTTAQAELTRAETATHPTSSRVEAMLRPGSRDEVQACVRIANRYGVPLYPVSSGKNWGYGSKVPSADAVLLELGRMNRIVDFDEDLAHVTIEPGVTQSQLHEFLAARGSRLWMDATGASPDCSVIGNTLERGFGHTPMGDHCANACGFEVVLPDGERIETGFARFEGSPLANLNRWGLGPSLDGLFSQSNFGIVTRMTIWLMPAPDCFQAFFFQCDDEGGLELVIEALRPLRLNGTLRSVIHIGNDYKVLAGVGQFPWDAESATPLARPRMDRLRSELGIGRWSGSGGLYGTRRQVAEARRLLKDALAGKVRRLQFVDDRLLRWLPRLVAPYRWITGHDLRRTQALLVPVYNLLKGIPTPNTLGSAYWRKRVPPPADPDPDRDRCGLLWLSPLAPATGRDATAVSRIAEEVMLRHGFEPMISVSMTNERTLVSVIAITYDRDVPGEDERALACHEELAERFARQGYLPYRLGLASMKHATSDEAYSRLVDALKRALDPAGILSPGRYRTPGNYATGASGHAKPARHRQKNDQARPTGELFNVLYRARVPRYR